MSAFRSHIRSALTAVLLMVLPVSFVAHAEQISLKPKNVEVKPDRATHSPSIQIQVDADSVKILDQFTRLRLNKKIAIRINGLLVMTPTLYEPLAAGELEISGGELDDVADAEKLADIIRRVGRIELEDHR